MNERFFHCPFTATISKRVQSVHSALQVKNSKSKHLTTMSHVVANPFQDENICFTCARKVLVVNQ